MSLASILKGIGRAFTLPKADRVALAANPLTPIVQTALANELGAAINAAVSKNVPTAQQTNVSNLLVAAVTSTGILGE